MKVILEDTWNADDIVTFCKEKGIECEVASQEELYAKEDFFECIYFCNTDIVRCQLQKHLKGNTELLNIIYPDTYESAYSQYYKRMIRRMNVGSLDTALLKENNIFVKPIGNDKRFDGRVISSLNDIDQLLMDDKEIVYACDVVNFLSESRLLIGNGKLYGYGHICKTKDYSFMSSMNINHIIELSKGSFRCIDVGLTKEKGWVIIEINPPFSLDDYEIPLDMYMNFCIGACEWINNLIKLI